MTVLEVMEYAEMFNLIKNPTMTMEAFCKVLNKSKRRVYTLLENKIYPEELIVDGYEYREKRKSPIFHTHKVIEWLKQ